MKLTTKGRYAVTALLDLAIHTKGEPINLTDISRRQDISLAYLEQIFSKLRRKGLVESARGPGGGYRLATAADDISIARILFCVDEPADITRCGGQQNCQADARCLTHDLWMGLNQHIGSYLNNITLGDLLQKKTIREVAERQDDAVIHFQSREIQ